jgi:hypothetical protein
MLASISLFLPYDDPMNQGCPAKSSDNGGAQLVDAPRKALKPPRSWIALVQRGNCSFAEKVRHAALLGAEAVVVGNNVESGRLEETIGSPGLVGMWSPGDTSDIRIPSEFISTNSYLDLLRVFEESREEDGDSDQVSGILVVLSKDQLLQWCGAPSMTAQSLTFSRELTDLLVLLLFLPSVITLFTLLSHRIRSLRQERRQRAPRQLVETLPWVIWGEELEKAAPVPPPVATTDSHASSSTDLEAGPPAPTQSRINHKLLLGWHRVKLWWSGSAAQESLIDPTINPARPWSYVTSLKLFSTQQDCAICLSDFERSEAVRVLSCGHLLQCVSWREPYCS